MALRRFYIETSDLTGDGILLRGDLFHHIREVCRFSVGDQFEALPGDGTALLVEITALTNKEIQARTISSRQVPPLAKPYITLALSVPKLPKVDWIIEKSVELGVAEIRPFVSEYSFLRKVSEISTNRIQRWHKLVQSATQQSGRGELMRIASPVSLRNLLDEFNRSPATGGLFPYEGEAQLKLPDALESLKSKKLDQIWVFVGSEGGFSRDEVALFSNAGLNPVSMGDQILRVETACLAIISVIKYELGR
ncbi:MAG: RsmE family RNA methyltransferase [Bdellovibrionales bacterium]